MQSKTLLIEDDCIKAMASIPEKTIDFILCDLPYGTTQNSWDSVISLDGLWAQYKRILSPRGVVALMGQGPFTARLILSQESMFKYKITWIKSKPTNFLNAKKQPLRKHEDICIYYAQQPKYFPQMSPGDPYDKGVRKNQLTGSYGEFSPAHIKSTGGRYPTDVIYFKTAESEGRVWHPTQKPVALGQYLIRTYTEPGDLVLDNCFGSASFLLAAAKENRHAIGIERNKDIVEFKKERLDLLNVAKERLFGFSDVHVCKLFDEKQANENFVKEFVKGVVAEKSKGSKDDTQLHQSQGQQSVRSGQLIQARV